MSPATIIKAPANSVRPRIGSNGVESNRRVKDGVHEFVMDVADGQQSVAEIAESQHQIIR